MWPIPLAAVVVTVALGILLPRIDVIVDADLPAGVHSAIFNGGADTARSVLSSIAGSLITATSLTFSLTVIALQLASSQASPRVLRLFARDSQVHWTLAAFLGTFAFSVTVLRSVRSSTEEISEFVPRIAVTLAFVLTLVSVLMLVFFLAHLAAHLRVETMLKEIHAETDRTIDLVDARNAAATAYPHELSAPVSKRAVPAASSGFITGHDYDALVALAVNHGIVIEERKRVGEDVVEGTSLAFWWPADGASAGQDDEKVEKAVRGAYSIGYERTAAEDIGYGVEQVVDIGLRGLSPGINDPTTAAHALGHLVAITARQVRITRLPAVLAGPDGRPCVRTVVQERADDIDAALSAMRHYGADHPSVVRRFVQAVVELASLCPEPDVTAALLAQLDALAQQLHASDADPATTAELLELTRDARTTVAPRGNRFAEAAPLVTE